MKKFYAENKITCWLKISLKKKKKLFLNSSIRSIKKIYNTLFILTENASRWCWPNGTWDNRTDYSHCHELKLPVVESSVEITTTLYFVGYVLSLSTLIVAVAIFLYYK